MTTLVGLARFVIVDLSGPSVPQELHATVPNFKIPFVPILETGRQSAAMISDILEYPWVVKPPVRFDSTAALLDRLKDSVIEPAERIVANRQRILDDLMPRGA